MSALQMRQRSAGTGLEGGVVKTTDHFATVVALRQLTGRDTPINHRIANVVAIVDRLRMTMESWNAIPPRAAAVDAAIVQVDALARALRELRAESAKAVTFDAA